jgi:hypothetical protein
MANDALKMVKYKDGWRMESLENQGQPVTPEQFQLAPNLTERVRSWTDGDKEPTLSKPAYLGYAGSLSKDAVCLDAGSLTTAQIEDSKYLALGFYSMPMIEVRDPNRLRKLAPQHPYCQS